MINRTKSIDTSVTDGDKDKTAGKSLDTDSPAADKSLGAVDVTADESPVTAAPAAVFPEGTGPGKEPLQLENPLAGTAASGGDIASDLKQLQELKALQQKHREILKENREAAAKKKGRTKHLVQLGKTLEAIYPEAAALNEDDMQAFIERLPGH